MAESARAETAKANEGVAVAHAEAAKANEAAAAANLALERERMERLKLEASVAPRSLSQTQANTLVAFLKSASPMPSIKLTLIGDEEANKYGVAIAQALEKAGVRGEASGVGLMVPLPYGLRDHLEEGLRNGRNGSPRL